MDPLSDMLSMLKVRSYGSAGLDAGGDWAVLFPKHDGVKFFAVVVGECWVSVEGARDPIKVQAGECFLSVQGKPFRMASDLAVDPIALHELLPPAFDGRIVTYNQGGDFLIVGGFLSLADRQADLLLKALPPLIHIREEPHRELLRWCVDRLKLELSDPQPGTSLIGQQLVTMMLVQALRLHLSDERHHGVGWLFALADRRMRIAIAAIHEDPRYRWTVQSLAKQAGMSRTNFALSFKKMVGLSPMDYLTRWRMLLAQDKLTTTRESSAEIGMSIGYDSERSFNKAFRRVNGCSPRQYRILGVRSEAQRLFGPPPR